MSDDPISRLEAQVAFLEQDLSGLRESVDAHQRQILALERHCELLTERLRQAIEDAAGGGASAPDDKPPHY